MGDPRSSPSSPGYPAKAVLAAEELLTRPVPAWRLSVDGRILAANLLAVWLWGGLRRRQVLRDRILGRQVFDVYFDNLSRIPLDQNSAFIRAKLLAAQRLGEDCPSTSSAAFITLLRSFQTARLRHPTRASKKEYSYGLRMRPPDNSYPIDVLDFAVDVYEIRGSRDWYGFLALYSPRAETSSFIATKYKYLLRNYGTVLNYVLKVRGKRGDTSVSEHITSHSAEVVDQEVSAFREGWNRWEGRFNGVGPPTPETLDEKRIAVEAFLNGWNRWEGRPDEQADLRRISRAVESVREAKSRSAPPRPTAGSYGSKGGQSTGSPDTTSSSR